MDRDADPIRRLRHTGTGSRARVTLWCGVCGLPRSCTTEQVSEYLRSRWPECCGRTMGLGHASPPPEATRPAD
jgi:hypothetical protein